MSEKPGCADRSPSGAQAQPGFSLTQSVQEIGVGSDFLGRLHINLLKWLHLFSWLISIASVARANSRVFAQGIRNVYDGISVLNLAEGALTQLSTTLIRMRELTTALALTLLRRE